MSTKKKVAFGKYISQKKYLDIRWLEKRVEVLKRDKEQCQGIGEDGKQCERSSKNGDRLEIHHRNYTSPDPWNEPPENLITLCRQHHEEEKNANLGQAARDVCSALMKSNWMVRQRQLLIRCISEKIITPEEFCRTIEERLR